MAQTADDPTAVVPVPIRLKHLGLVFRVLGEALKKEQERELAEEEEALLREMPEIFPL